MRARRLSRRDYQRRFARAAQLLRLEKIARGEFEPRGPRETLFHDLHRLGRRPNPREFVLSWPLLRLELEWLQAEAELFPDDCVE